MSVDIANESDIPIDEASLARLCRFLLCELDVNPLAELSVLLIDVDYMASLNEKWMHTSGPTDVLAFPMDELDTARRPDEADPSPSLLGDVVLCPAVAIKQASAAGHNFDAELHLLTTHGVLHLLGYDHAEPDEEREMFAVQRRLLDGWLTHRTENGHPA
ncbi:MAG: rRNA maturation RNase YbeY [Geodermatophilaceae bacterium]|jgi:probable rRNA maturation factor|nr:rRNA maturation RNase YbeY [Geodermatophilaceae bacterium]